jgi:hypothetical protein
MPFHEHAEVALSTDAFSMRFVNVEESVRVASRAKLSKHPTAVEWSVTPDAQTR